MPSRASLERLAAFRRTFFVRVSLWFWLGMVLVLAAFALSTLLTEPNSLDRTQRTLIASVLPQQAAKIVAAFETRGPAKVNESLEGIDRLIGLRLLLYDDSLIELAGGDANSPLLHPAMNSMLEQARLRGQPQAETIGGAHIFVQPVMDGHGRKFYVVLLYPTALRRIFRADWSAQLVRLTACLLVGGLICIWFAWKLTKPVRGLRTAAVKLASGDLAVRVDPELRNRSDEFAELGRDFDVMAERLESLVEAHRQLLSDVSHELRSPLARLSVALGLARQRSGPETTDLFDHIERETNRLNGLIGQLLSLAQIESGAEFRRERFDLYLVLEAAAADGDFEARARGCRVQLHGDEPCWVDGSPELLRSAAENVIRNAIRHSPEGASVEVSILREEAGESTKAVVTVRDHGTGVPETSLPRLFEPFFRVPPGSGKEARGTGLGLAITQRAVRLHNGSVVAQNAPNGGLLVTLRVPLSAG